MDMQKGGRDLRRSVPWPVRSGFRALGGVSPALAAWLFERLWFMPPRPKISEAVRAGLDALQPLEMQVHGRRVRGWTQGDGPTVLLVHGWGGYSGQLLGFVAPLVARGLRVVAYDAPGHGLSEPSRLGRYQSSFFEFEAVLHEAASRHGHVHGLVAHSGGCNAATLALRSGLSVRQAVYISPMAVPSGYAAVFAEAMGASPEVTRRFMENSADRLGFSWEDFDVTRAPQHVQTPPLLVVHDQLDAEVPHSEGASVAESWPHSALYTTRGLGHRRILGDGEVIARAAGFLAGEARRVALPPCADAG
jgi:pimeloyl-ACP methyl ester carboxylesterase